jgi:hypothetical protein
MLTLINLTRDVVSGLRTVFLALGNDCIWCRVKDEDPASASLELSTSTLDSPPNSPRRIETRAEGTLISSTVDYFMINIESALLENGKVMRSCHWKDQIRREQV